ncbi:hypothetical protein ACTMTI_50380 [Nonomuraea sp. H19]|uniref:hypothetical protein n=1 Tax=Nonomuraea sp. H19 TaxID=3452206 RepID=UPI003F8A4B84
MNVEDLDIAVRCAHVVSKGGAIDYVHWATPGCQPTARAGRSARPPPPDAEHHHKLYDL